MTTATIPAAEEIAAPHRKARILRFQDEGLAGPCGSPLVPVYGLRRRCIIAGSGQGV